jgi:hypothetical protein
MLLAGIRPDAGKTKPPEPPAPPSVGSKPAPKPIPPSGGSSDFVPPSPPAEIRKTPASPKDEAVNSTGSEIKDAPASQTASPAVAAEVPQQVASQNAEVPNLNQTEVVVTYDVSQHESLKNEIRAEAESLDFTVTPETSIPQHGRIDLILTRGEKSIACEISVTTTPKTEADHIRLRLKAGFKHVAVISENRRKLNLIQAAFLEQSGNKDASKVGF